MIRIEDIVEKVATNHAQADLDLLRRAYLFSAKEHKGQKRASGESYLVHPLEVANILADMKLDEVSVATGLLHDVVEDTLVDLDTIRRYFGEEITHLVDGLTKIAQISNISREEQQAEDRPSRESPVQHQRDAERERDLEDERQDDDDRVVRHRLLEGRFRQRALVVLQADEVGQWLEPVPVIQAEVRRLDDRDEHEDAIQQQGGQQEQPDRGEARPARTGRRDAGPFGGLPQERQPPFWAALEMVWVTCSGVPVWAKRVATASLMTAPSSGVVAWSRYSWT